ncbi:MAG: carbohydrate kinase family protein [Patescibacteria group bacterium]
MKQFDFLAIGDIMTDAFIRLKDASVHCDINREKCELCMPFAEKIPFEFVKVVRAVGNGPNAAVSAARLGLNSAMMTDIGNDENGRECVTELKKNKVSAKFVTRHKNKKTNYHYVLWFEDERTILVKHEAFPYKFSPPRKNPRWVYITSLGGDSLPYQLEIAKWLEENPDIRMAFQPGTFQMNAGYEKLIVFYRRAEIFFCNVEEAKRILKKTGEIKELLVGIHELGPKIVVITDGPKGAYAYDGADFWFMPPYPDPKPPYERTGAGDAFSSTFTVALALGKNLAEALMWSPINSMSVVQDIGSQKGLLTREKLEEYLKNAPTDYAPRKI